MSIVIDIHLMWLFKLNLTELKLNITKISFSHIQYLKLRSHILSVQYDMCPVAIIWMNADIEHFHHLQEVLLDRAGWNIISFLSSLQFTALTLLQFP